MTIELKANQLWAYITVKKRWNGTEWLWSYQLGEDTNENFTGTSSTKRGAVKRAKRAAKRAVAKMTIVQLNTEEFDQ